MNTDSQRLSKLRSLLEAEPNDGFLLYGAAQELHKLGRFDEAAAFYDRAIEVDPKECYAFFHKAKSLEQAGRRAEAAQSLRTGLVRARAVGDHKAASEIEAYLDDME
ncbi:MAG: tetratricopeptide repeat protein [Planctomycetota bacterium]|jgi:tetratricopeptide (TPR) repeat protein|nr:MAG: tetratricopeptide repeat protein [Planctomycetota bacterium]